MRDQVKNAFRLNSSLSSDAELNKAINTGRYYVREMQALCQLHKYRTLRGRYVTDDEINALGKGTPQENEPCMECI